MLIKVSIHLCFQSECRSCLLFTSLTTTLSCGTRAKQGMSDLLPWPVNSPLPQVHTCEWWRHHMDTRYALLYLCEGNPPVNGGLPSQRTSNTTGPHLWLNSSWTNWDGKMSQGSMGTGNIAMQSSLTRKWIPTYRQINIKQAVALVWSSHFTYWGRVTHRSIYVSKLDRQWFN